MNVYLHIDHLVVDGIDLGNRGELELQTALQETLTRLLMERSLGGDVHGAAADVLAAAPLSVSAKPDAASLGSQLGQSLFGSLQGAQTIPGQPAPVNGRGTP